MKLKVMSALVLRCPRDIIAKIVNFNLPSSFRHFFKLPFAFQHIFNLPSTLPSSFQYTRFIECTILGCCTKMVFNLPILLQSYFQITVRISIYQSHPMIKIMRWGHGKLKLMSAWVHRGRHRNHAKVSFNLPFEFRHIFHLPFAF